jgi:hypothetical protein
MFLSKATTYPSKAPCALFWGRLLGLPINIRPEKPAIKNTLSILRAFINYIHKMFYNIGHRANIINLFVTYEWLG